MRFLPQGYGGKMFIGAVSAEQSDDLETTFGQTRVVCRKGLHHFGRVVVLGAAGWFDPSHCRILLSSPIWKSAEEIEYSGIGTLVAFNFIGYRRADRLEIMDDSKCW